MTFFSFTCSTRDTASTHFRKLTHLAPCRALLHTTQNDENRAYSHTPHGCFFQFLPSLLNASDRTARATQISLQRLDSRLARNRLATKGCLDLHSLRRKCALPTSVRVEISDDSLHPLFATTHLSMRQMRLQTPTQHFDTTSADLPRSSPTNLPYFHSGLPTRSGRGSNTSHRGIFAQLAIRLCGCLFGPIVGRVIPPSSGNRQYALGNRCQPYSGAPDVKIFFRHLVPAAFSQ